MHFDIDYAIMFLFQLKFIVRLLISLKVFSWENNILLNGQFLLGQGFCHGYEPNAMKKKNNRNILSTFDVFMAHNIETAFIQSYWFKNLTNLYSTIFPNECAASGCEFNALNQINSMPSMEFEMEAKQFRRMIVWLSQPLLKVSNCDFIKQNEHNKFRAIKIQFITITKELHLKDMTALHQAATSAIRREYTCACPDKCRFTAELRNVYFPNKLQCNENICDIIQTTDFC